MSSEHLNDASAVRPAFATWLHSLIVRSKTVLVDEYKVCPTLFENNCKVNVSALFENNCKVFV